MEGIKVHVRKDKGYLHAKAGKLHAYTAGKCMHARQVVLTYKAGTCAHARQESACMQGKKIACVSVSI